MLRPEKILCHGDLDYPHTRACSNRDRGSTENLARLSKVASARGFDFGGFNNNSARATASRAATAIASPYQTLRPVHRHKIQITTQISPETSQPSSSCAGYLLRRSALTSTNPYRLHAESSEPEPLGFSARLVFPPQNTSEEASHLPWSGFRKHNPR